MYIQVKGNCSQIGRHEEAMTPEYLHVFFLAGHMYKVWKIAYMPWDGDPAWVSQNKNNQFNFLPIVI